MSMVFQNYALYPNMTVYGNIAYSLKIRKVPKKTIDQKVREVARILEIESLLDRKPTALSGGQKQRIAIARMMLKNAPIVILDEATASVDPENERQLQEAFEALTRDKTVIMIAHRLSTVRKADQILVLDGGRIVGCATHSDLLRSCETYREIALSQLSAAELGQEG